MSGYRLDAATLFRELDLFVPNARGPNEEVIRLAFQAANQTFPLLNAIVDETGACHSAIVDVEAFCKTKPERTTALKLKELLDRYGSDKANIHNYHLVYGAILTRMGSIQSLLEIGLGTNNVSLISNMGAAGRPGASLRAFRDFLPGAQVYGADVDRNILFTEERITTFFIDQTDPTSFREAEAVGGLDLLIDDGLHTPNANLAALRLGLSHINVGGWIVIEDIPPRAMPVWKVVGAILPLRYRTSIIRTRGGLLFTVERTS
jgi:hypothetical protein